MIPVKGYKNQIVGVLGLGRTGLSTAYALLAGGAIPLLWDDNQLLRNKAQELGFKLVDVESKKFKEMTLLIVSPGIPHLYPEPHSIIVKALQLGVAIDNDISLFFRSFATSNWRTFQVEPKIICVTGSNGKSTTCKLLKHILDSKNFDVEIGGNFGKSALELSEATDGCIKILEISSYQSELARTLQPDLAVFLNFSDDHLDRHSGKGGYFAAKARLFCMGVPEKSIISIDDYEGLYLSNRMQEEQTLANPVINISALKNLPGLGWNIFNRKGFMVEYRNKKQVYAIDLRQNKVLVGDHGYQNASAAYAVSRALGISPKDIESSLSSFSGLRHRAEILGKKNGVTFVNDSKATNAAAAAASVGSFKNIRWILGGVSKADGISPLLPISENVKSIYLIGSSAKEFSSKLSQVEHRISYTLDRAIVCAFKDAEIGDTVLLAPACASFDQFNNFEDRGDKFKALFSSLKGA